MTADTSPHKYLFTIFIPTFNRAYILPRTLSSIEAQTLHDFEVLIVDDGSTDNTRDLVREWAERMPFEVRYCYQTNGGKHVAHNTMLGLAHGEFVVLLDSDDVLVPGTLDRFRYHWNQIPRDKRDRFAGVEGLIARLDNGCISGKPYPQNIVDGDHLEMRVRCDLGGDRRAAVLTDILRRFPYPVFAGERHIRPSLLWDRLAEAGYKFRFFNEVVQLYEHQADGLSANRFSLRMANPRGMRLCMQEEIRLHGRFLGLRQRWRLGVKYVRYSLHAGYGYMQQYSGIYAKALWLASVVPGTVSWLVDLLRLKLRAMRRPN
jgi:glycosyltransferase involved in cell wall biosynthesis